MRLASACFQFFGSDDEPIMVWFHADEAGKPSEVSVVIGAKTFRVENINGRYKPCMTHARELIDLRLQKPPKSAFASERRKKTKPVLRIAVQ